MSKRSFRSQKQTTNDANIHSQRAVIRLKHDSGDSSFLNGSDTGVLDAVSLETVVNTELVKLSLKV